MERLEITGIILDNNKMVLNPSIRLPNILIFVVKIFLRHCRFLKLPVLRKHSGFFFPQLMKIRLYLLENSHIADLTNHKAHNFQVRKPVPEKKKTCPSVGYWQSG